MTAVAKTQDAQVVTGEVITTEATTLMEVISRIASDPNADMGKLERMADLYERINAKSAEAAYDDAMSKAQAQLSRVAADANNPQTKSRYATYAALDKAVRPVYTAHGFSLSFYTGEGAPADFVRLYCKVAHRGGHCERPYLDMPADGKGAKGGDVMTKTHATGSALSYGQRYLLKMIFNIAVGDTDDDGNAAGGQREQSAGMTAAITTINLAETVQGLQAWKAKNAGALAEMPTAEADEVVRLWNARHKVLRDRATKGAGQ